MEDAIDTAPARAGTPWHLWVVGVLSLLWNAFGGYDYTMTMLRDPGYLGMVAEQMHIPLTELLAFFDSFPAWAGALWAIGVWGSVLGSILLLMRSRHAVTAFLVSLVGAVLSFAYQMTIDVPPEMTDDPMSKFMPIVIIAAIVLQWWYARRQAASGVLR